jgi:hypothetical protein
MTDRDVTRWRNSREWLNGGECCGDTDSVGTCAAPACIFGEAVKELQLAADRIEHLENRCANLLVGNGALNIRSDKLEEALHEVAKLNNRRDRFSSDIDAIIINALGEEP